MYMVYLPRTISLLEIFKQHYPNLVHLLPMDDNIFFANLYGKNLLPGDLKANIKSLSTPAEKAMKFLDAVIEPAINNNERAQFKLLLSIMNDSDNITVKSLAEEIMSALNYEQLNGQTGEHIVQHNYIVQTPCTLIKSYPARAH